MSAVEVEAGAKACLVGEDVRVAVDGLSGTDANVRAEGSNPRSEQQATPDVDVRRQSWTLQMHGCIASHMLRFPVFHADIDMAACCHWSNMHIHDRRH